MSFLQRGGKKNEEELFMEKNDKWSYGSSPLRSLATYHTLTVIITFLLPERTVTFAVPFFFDIELDENEVTKITTLEEALKLLEELQ